LKADDLYLAQLEARLGGSRRSRRRLLREIGDHLDDSAVAEVARGAETGDAQRSAVARLGTVDVVAQAWHGYRRRRRVTRRRRVAAVALAAAVASALGAAQYASGGRRDVPSPAGCAKASRHDAACKAPVPSRIP
jgi:hypothetical protein